MILSVCQALDAGDIGRRQSYHSVMRDYVGFCTYVLLWGVLNYPEGVTLHSHKEFPQSQNKCTGVTKAETC